MCLYFKTKTEYNKLMDIRNGKNKALQVNIINPLYRYDMHGWMLSDKYGTKNAEKDIFGYDDYIKRIEKDIKNHIKYNEFLKELGEIRSINYLLYGPPGTGKTSLIKAIASKLECPVCIVKPNNIHINDINKVLSPSITMYTKCKLKLLLFEDFDRFLENNNINEYMSDILNSLDGFNDKGDVIRFFTANNEKNIFKIDALINRMSSKYRFYYPTREIFKGKLQRFLSYYESYDSDKIEKFLDLVVTKDITIRPFVNYIVRYLFDENYLDVMIDNIDEL